VESRYTCNVGCQSMTHANTPYSIIFLQHIKGLYVDLMFSNNKGDILTATVPI
jgi:hypothetical protein